MTVWQTETAIPDVDLIVVPGGFSFGDYLRCGAIAARSPVMRAVAEAAAKGVPVLGVCNGFQILCEAGLLPGALMRNTSLRFVCREVKLEVVNATTRFTGGYTAGPDHPLPGRPSRRQLFRRRRDAEARSRATTGSSSATPRAPIRTARSATSPASSTRPATSSA